MMSFHHFFKHENEHLRMLWVRRQWALNHIRAGQMEYAAEQFKAARRRLSEYREAHEMMIEQNKDVT